MNKTKVSLAVGGAVLVLGLVGGGVALAEHGSAPANAAAPSSAPPTSGSKQAHPKGGKHQGDGMLRGVEHGEFTVRKDNADKVVDVQQGEVTAVSDTSISVKSQDGFTATYVVNADTKVHKGKGKTDAKITDVKTGDKVRVLADKSGSTLTATRIADAS